MLETHEYEGVWWLPADDSMKLNGKLTIRGGAAELGVVGFACRCSATDRSRRHGAVSGSNDGSYDVELSVCTEAGDVVSVTRALRVAPRLEPG
jgi:hypothetical protein